MGETVLTEEDWKGVKDLEVFTYLAAHYREPIHEDRLMDLFWGRDGRRARHSLHNSISQIRKTLSSVLDPRSAKRSIVKRRRGYVFGLELECDIDLVQFETVYREGTEAWNRGAHEDGLVSLQRAEELGRAEFLPGHNDEWSLEIRFRLVEKLRRCRSLLAHYFADRAKWLQAIQMWNRVLEIDNCSEEAYLELMRCHLALEKRAEAVKIYQACSKIMREELELPPPAEVEALYHTLTES